MKLFLIIFLVTLTSAFPRNDKNGSISNFIIGGQEAYAGQFPYVVAIYSDKLEGTFFCSGTLINSQWVLTAGYCVQNATRFSIYLGLRDIEGDEENSLVLVAHQYKLHPDFNPQTLRNNLGLIKFSKPITFTPYMRPVNILTDIDYPDFTIVVASGWGQTSDNVTAPVDKIHYVHLATLPLDECRMTYGDVITNKMVCVGGNRQQGTCNGDIGGPLVHIEFEQGEVVILLGIASFISGTDGCENDHPSGYTKISPYREWIFSTMAQTE